MEHQGEILDLGVFRRVQENERDKAVDDGKADSLLSTAQKATVMMHISQAVCSHS